MHVTGIYSGEPYLKQYSYYFSKMAHVGAWASWRRAWQKYDISLATFPKFLAEKQMLNIYHGHFVAGCWNWIFNFLYQEKVKNTWDFQWAYAIYSNNGLTVHPGVNLITNIGFTNDATHGSSTASPLANKKNYSIELPLNHPAFVLANATGDAWKNRHLVGATWYNFGLKQLLRSIGLFNLVKKLFYFLRLN